jgi:hypothetical protein
MGVFGVQPFPAPCMFWADVFDVVHSTNTSQLPECQQRFVRSHKFHEFRTSYYTLARVTFAVRASPRMMVGAPGF